MAKTAVVVFGFGSPSGLPANRFLCKAASKKATELSAVILTEPDVFCPDSRVEVAYVVTKSPAPTFRLARAAAIQAKKDGVDTFWIVCSPLHLNRCFRDLRYATRQVGLKANIFVCEISENVEWFSPKAEQRHARIENAWHIRNGILTAMPMWLYTKIAS